MPAGFEYIHYDKMLLKTDQLVCRFFIKDGWSVGTILRLKGKGVCQVHYFTDPAKKSYPLKTDEKSYADHKGWIFVKNAAGAAPPQSIDYTAASAAARPTAAPPRANETTMTTQQLKLAEVKMRTLVVRSYI